MDLTQITDKEMTKLQDTFKEMKKMAMEDPVYFFDTFLYTFDPKNKPFHLRFKTFPFQKRLIRDMIDAIHDGNDLFIEKCREMGATYTVLGVFLWMWLCEPASNFLLGSRKEDYVDNRRGGLTGNKEESLFGKLDYMISRLPDFIMPAGWNKSKHFNYMSLVNPENGNVISGESANENFSRGGRQKAILLDEYAFWDRDEAVWGSTADTTKCRIILTTPGIRPCKAKRLRFGKDGEKIKVITLHYNLDPRKTPAWLERERTRRSSEDFNREIMINWELATAGRIYPEIDKALIGDFPFIPGATLYVSWDLGLDGTAILFWQQNKENGKYRLIDSYFNQDRPIPFFFPLFGKPMESMFTYTDDDRAAISEISQYPQAIHFGDPDVEKRAFQDASAISTRSVMAKSGIYIQSIPSASWIFRRDITKVYIQKGVEIRKTKRNEYTFECLKADRYKMREKGQEFTTAPQRVHGIESHFGTSMEYFFINIDSFQTAEQKAPAWASKFSNMGDKVSGWLTNRSKLSGGRR
jgi:hypothetical protein